MNPDTASLSINVRLECSSAKTFMSRGEGFAVGKIGWYTLLRDPVFASLGISRKPGRAVQFLFWYETAVTNVRTCFFSNSSPYSAQEAHGSWPDLLKSVYIIPNLS